MTKLEYGFKNDTLFKMLFTQYPNLLKRLVSSLLGISYNSIGNFSVNNPEIQPDSFGEKFCRLDISMTIDGQYVDLEIQIENEGNYPERSLYYWARAFSSALAEGMDYKALPRTVHISILAFSLFECEEYVSEFRDLEVRRHVPLTDKLSLQFYELPKIPKKPNRDNELELWLALFKAETQEALERITNLEVPIMNEAIEAYRHITATAEFKELERLRSKARHDEAQAVSNAEERERAKWKVVVMTKDAALAERDAELSEQKAEIERLRKLLAERQNV